MKDAVYEQVIGPALASALEKRGYTSLTAVQQAVLDEQLAGRDLRITSQTGSGKTVAIGLALRKLMTEPAPAIKGVAQPRALVVAPTRELAKQVESELSWLYAELPVRVVSVTGGASYRQEHRALGAGPAVVVGTPGRLVDHLRQGSINPAQVQVVVIDEADRMLDLGFREDLETILGLTPEERCTHLVSATFPREVRALADRVQSNPAHVEGTRLGAANADIDHVIHLVAPEERLDAVINLLLANPAEQTLVFARTRLEVAGITQDLEHAGFHVASLSGEMAQNERNRALAAFKRGYLRVLVATDVAARGIDVQDIARVIHFEPPTNADNYTHRSGRTGRAGRRGISSVLVTPNGLRQAEIVLRRVNVPFHFYPIPSAEAIRRAREEQLFAELTASESAEAVGFDASILSLALRLSQAEDVALAIGRLLVRAQVAGPTEPRQVRHFDPPAARTKSRKGRERHERSRDEAPFFGAQADSERPRAGRSNEKRSVAERPSRDRDKPMPLPVGPSREGSQVHRRPKRDAAEQSDRSWVPFQVTWGAEKGADARRLVAMLCRRGKIRGTDIGAIRIESRVSIVDVASDVAESFAVAARRRDQRDPNLTIRPASQDSGERPPREEGHARAKSRPAKPRPAQSRPTKPSKFLHKKPSSAAAGDEKPRKRVVKNPPKRPAKPNKRR